MRMRRSLSTVAFPLILLLAAFAAPPPTVACSCMQPEPMAAYRGDPLKLVFVGTIQSAGLGGVDVAVEQWFQGGFAPFVRLGGRMFGDQSAACQVRLPEVGTSWVYVAFIPEPGGEPQVNLCTPHELRYTLEGQAMFNDIVAAFGPGLAAGGAPGEVATPPPDLLGPAVAVAATALVGLGLFGLLVAMARRRRAGG